ncbi:MAG: cob(I)yrinic acid a,c-diamide adenosyltransferase [Actinobacteria bacterium]|nr:MAG: cob(I)yrinic acid a,c-diamide adenosyltransferase [Actinomycetota bacterium]
MTGKPPRSGPGRATTRAPSLVLVNTGDGKGKTTAALGTALRAAGRGLRVCVMQFLKSPSWKTGEAKAGRELGIDWWTLGDGFTWDSKDMARTQEAAIDAWSAARAKIASGDYDLVVLDELTYPVTWGWISEDDVVDALRARPAHTSVIITGRDAPAALVDAADTVTEMVKTKHAFDAGIKALKGIDL